MKIAKFCISLVISIALGVGLFIFGNHLDFFQPETHSETFTGYISTATYNDKVSTAKAYLSEELAGASAAPVYKKYTKLYDLSKSQLSSSKINVLTEDEILGGEVGAIDYSSEGKDFVVNAHILRTASGYRYYVAPQKRGEALTNSYLNSVLDGDKYLNCTVTTTLNMRLISSSATTDTIYRQSIYFDDDKVFFNQDLPGITQDWYLVEKENRINVYYSNGDPLESGYELYLIKNGDKIAVKSLHSIKEVTDFAFAMPIDASYFVKTDQGFSMTNEKYKAVCASIIGEEFADEIGEKWGEYHVHFRADYYVSNGRLSATQMVLTMSNGDEVFALTIEVKYSDFEKTEVNVPQKSA